jgi:hypothetical protein
MKLSDFLTLNWHDLLIGTLTAAGSAIVAIIAPSIQSWVNSLSTPNPANFSLIFNWTVIWHTAVAGAFGYLQVKFLSPAPKVLQVDTSKTVAVDSDTKQPLIKENLNDEK